MEIRFDNKKQVFGYICLIMAFAWGLNHLSAIWKVLKYVIGIFSPFLLGGAIAFVMNVPMRPIERGLKKRLKHPKPMLVRTIALLLVFTGVVLVVLVVAALVIPEIARTLIQLNEGIPSFIAQINNLLLKVGEKHPEFAEYFGNVNLDWENISGTLLEFLRNGLTNFISSTVSVATSVIGRVATTVIGVIFSVYILLRKETLCNQAAKLVLAYAPSKGVGRIFEITQLTGRIFSGFIAGQCLEAVLFGIFCYTGMSIFRFPFAMAIAVLIGFSTLVPMLGCFVGTTIGFLLILVENPVQAVWFIVLMVVIQQLDGNLVYPKVVGNSVGMPGMWVLMAVTIGGSLMGIVGMLIFVPLCSVLYTLLRQNVEKRLLKKQTAL